MTNAPLTELSALIAKYSKAEGANATNVPGLQVLRMSAPSMRLPVVYNPSICIIVQGRKQVLLESEIYHYAPSEFLAVSIDLPVLGQVLEASADKPYLCLQIDIDPHQMGEMITQSGEPVATSRDAPRGLFVGTLDDAMLDCALRLTRLLDTPKDVAPLTPIIMREFYYRLINGAYASSIVQMVMPGSNMQRIATVIKRIKSDLTQPIRIEDLAGMASMSPSSFHHYFKQMTAMSPLQYQKRLRLTEARHIMLTEQTDAASTAYRVGYESASQFSREYSRMFGAPPMRDIEGILGR